MTPVHFEETLDPLSGESVSGRLGGGVRRCRTAFLYSAQLSRAGTLDGTALISNSFLVQCPRSRPDLAMFLVTRSGADQPGPGMGEALGGQRIFAVRGALRQHLSLSSSGSQARGE